MKEQESIRYLQYLGLEAPRPQNKRGARSVLASNPAMVIGILVVVLLVLAVSAIAHHATIGIVTEGAPAAVSSTADEQEAPASGSPLQALSDDAGSGGCATCEGLAAFLGLVTYCLAYVSMAY